jgi:pimeloyl-ACP methyl ester carboxylesterase
MRATFIALVFLVGGCAAKPGVVPTTDEQYFARSQVNALTANEASEEAQYALQTRGLDDAFKKRPVEVLEELDRELCVDPDRETALVLAELCHLVAKRSRDASLAARLDTSSAIYAYAWLFDPGFAEPVNEFGPRFRFACDLHDRSLANVLEYTQQAGRRERETEELVLPMLRGTLVVHPGETELPFDLPEFETFLPTYRFAVKGVDRVHRQYGIGVPLIAIRRTDSESDAADEPYLSRANQAYGATFVIELHDDVLDRSEADLDLSGTARVYDPLRTRAVEIAGQRVALEIDTTTPLAYMLSKADQPPGIQGLVDVEAWNDRRGLHLLQPYQPEKIPLVFIHGLMSSPITWLPMFNDLLGDPEIREHYQFWFFMYPTGNPILYSAAVVRDALLQVRRELDPEGTDTAFDRTVLVGHSMGGVISKFLVQSSGDELWSIAFDEPLDELDVTPDERELLRAMLYFEPLPYVERVIFISAPHRGSDLATGPLNQLADALIKLPGNLVQFGSDVLTLQAYRDPFGSRHTPTSVDSLRPDNPVLVVSAEMPIADRVTYHTICGNQKEADVPEGSDGVVPYWSSHLEGATTELIVEGGHSNHVLPRTIYEVRRILREHVEAE